jgi:hypothetical protein
MTDACIETDFRMHFRSDQRGPLQLTCAGGYFGDARLPPQQTDNAYGTSITLR